MHLEVAGAGREVAAAEPEGEVNEGDEGGDFDEGADDSDEGFAGVDAEDGYCNCDGEFEVVTGGGEGKCGGLRVVRTEALAHPEADEKHDEEVDDQRDGNAHDVERQAHDEVALEREHDQNCEQQRRERERTDARKEACAIPDRKSTRLNSSHLGISYA